MCTNLRRALSDHLHTFAGRNTRSRGTPGEPDYLPLGSGDNTRWITTAAKLPPSLEKIDKFCGVTLGSFSSAEKMEISDLSNHKIRLDTGT